MSNGKSPFPDKPNRDRLFATQLTGSGSSTSLSYSGHVNISPSLLVWGDANGYDFTSSAQAGVDSKAVDGSQWKEWSLVLITQHFILA